MTATPLTNNTTTGSTVGLANNFRHLIVGGCAGPEAIDDATAGDRAFSITIPAGQRLLARLTAPDGGQTSNDSVLNLVVGLNNCGSNATNDAGLVITSGITCSAAVDDPQPQTLSYLNLTNGSQTAYLIVDSYDDRESAFKLDVAFDVAPAGDICETATALSTGTPLTGQTLAALSDDYSRGIGCGFAAGPDRVYSVAVPANNRLTVRVQASAGLTSAVSIANTMGCRTDMTCLSAAIVPLDGGAGQAQFDNSGAAAQTIAVIVDSLAPVPPSATFDISAALSPVPPSPPGDRCMMPVAIAASGTLMGETTVGYANDVEVPTACTMYSTSGPDKIYSVTVPANQRLIATITPVSPTPMWDPALYVIDPNSCGRNATCVLGIDSGGGNMPDTLTFANTSANPRALLLVVDSFLTSQIGTYDLRIQIIP